MNVSTTAAQVVSVRYTQTSSAHAVTHAQDSDLVSRLACGDEHALGALFDKWSDIVFRIVVRILRNERAAEEMVEDVFWHAWLHADTFRTFDGTPGSWLIQIALQKTLDALAKNTR